MKGGGAVNSGECTGISKAVQSVFPRAGEGQCPCPPEIFYLTPAISRRRAMRSLMSGWVLNSLAMPPPKRGATMNISAVVGLPFCMGMRWFHDWSLPSAAARARGCPQQKFPGGRGQ